MPLIRLKLRELTPASLLGCVIPVMLVNLGVIAAIIYVIVHFIRKVW